VAGATGALADGGSGGISVPQPSRMASDKSRTQQFKTFIVASPYAS
jgi:hypothetical protein